MIGGKLNRSVSPVRARLRHWETPMAISLNDLLLFSCLVALATRLL